MPLWNSLIYGKHNENGELIHLNPCFFQRAISHNGFSYTSSFTNMVALQRKKSKMHPKKFPVQFYLNRLITITNKCRNTHTSLSWGTDVCQSLKPCLHMAVKCILVDPITTARTALNTSVSTPSNTLRTHWASEF